MEEYCVHTGNCTGTVKKLRLIFASVFPSNFVPCMSIFPTLRYRYIQKMCMRSDSPTLMNDGNRHIYARNTQNIDSLLFLNEKSVHTSDMKLRMIFNDERSQQKKCRKTTFDLEEQLINEKRKLQDSENRNKILDENLRLIISENIELRSQIELQDEEFRNKMEGSESTLLQKLQEEEQRNKKLKQEVVRSSKERGDLLSRIALQSNESRRFQRQMEMKLLEETQKVKEHEFRFKKLKEDFQCLTEEITLLRSRMKIGNIVNIESQQDIDNSNEALEKINDQTKLQKDQEKPLHDDTSSKVHSPSLDIENVTCPLPNSKFCNDNRRKLENDSSIVNRKSNERERRGILIDMKNNVNFNESSEVMIHTNHGKIRSHAEKMLLLAEKAISQSQNSLCNSTNSSMGTDFRPKNTAFIPSSKCSGRPPLPVKSNKKCDIVISNLDTIEKSSNCSCQLPPSGENGAHADFYLPKFHMECSCDKGNAEPSGDSNLDPYSLRNILRDWQCDFLASIGIVTASALVAVCDQNMNAVARKMRVWRKIKKLRPVKTKSCAVALYIWSRTCAAVIRSFEAQKAKGIVHLRKPDFLNVSVSENRSMSTLGFGSVQFE